MKNNSDIFGMISLEWYMGNLIKVTPMSGTALSLLLKIIHFTYLYTTFPHGSAHDFSLTF